MFRTPQPYQSCWWARNWLLRRLCFLMCQMFRTLESRQNWWVYWTNTIFIYLFMRYCEKERKSLLQMSTMISKISGRPNFKLNPPSYFIALNFPIRRNINVRLCYFCYHWVIDVREAYSSENEFPSKFHWEIFLTENTIFAKEFM